jgi:hypothetical protein
VFLSTSFTLVADVGALISSLHRLPRTDASEVLAVAIDPRTCPTKSGELSLFFRIKNTEYPRGFNYLCVAGDGSAACVLLR